MMLRPFVSEPHSSRTLRADYATPRSPWAAGCMVGFSAEILSMVRTLFSWTHRLWEMWLNFTQAPFYSVPPYLQSSQVKLGSQTSLPARLGLLQETATIAFKVSVSVSDSVPQHYVWEQNLCLFVKNTSHIFQGTTHTITDTNPPAHRGMLLS